MPCTPLESVTNAPTVGLPRESSSSSPRTSSMIVIVTSGTRTAPGRLCPSSVAFWGAGRAAPGSARPQRDHHGQVVVVAQVPHDAGRGAGAGEHQPHVAAHRPQGVHEEACVEGDGDLGDRKSTRLNSSHVKISY